MYCIIYLQYPCWVFCIKLLFVHTTHSYMCLHISWVNVCNSTFNNKKEAKMNKHIVLGGIYGHIYDHEAIRMVCCIWITLVPSCWWKMTLKLCQEHPLLSTPMIGKDTSGGSHKLQPTLQSCLQSKFTDDLNRILEIPNVKNRSQPEGEH